MLQLEALYPRPNNSDDPHFKVEFVSSFSNFHSVVEQDDLRPAAILIFLMENWNPHHMFLHRSHESTIFRSSHDYHQASVGAEDKISDLV